MNKELQTSGIREITNKRRIASLKEFRRLYLFFFCICVIINLFVINSVYSSWSVIRGSYFIPSSEWVTTQGRVESVKPVTGRTKSKRYYNVSISYTFSVNGMEYRGGDVQFSPMKSWQEAADKTKFYKINPNVAVHYEKGNPNLSVLNLNGKTDVTGDVSIFLASLLCGLFLMRSSIKVNSLIKNASTQEERNLG